MKILTGHLSPMEKKVVKIMLEKKLTSGNHKKTDYHISQNNGIYTVKVQKMDFGIIKSYGQTKKQFSSYTTTFKT